MKKMISAATMLLVAAAPVAAASPAGASQSPQPRTAANLGETSLATVLAADGARFDRNWKDFDILDAAVTAVLKAKPTSKVAVLADGTTPLTAFLPTDRAFRKLARSLTGKAPRTEKRTFRVLTKKAGIDTIEAVLLYHVVPGATVDSAAAGQANGAMLTTAQGGKIQVAVSSDGIRLVDADPNARDPKVIAVDINKGNKQIAHGINLVLRPLDL